MPEVFLNHQLKSFGGTSGIASDHWVSGHNLANRSGMGVQTFSGNLAPAIRTCVQYDR